MDIWNEVLAAEADVIRCRRYIHENPELSAAGIRCEDVPGGGVMGFIDGAQPGNIIPEALHFSCICPDPEKINPALEHLCSIYHCTAVFNG